MEEKTVNCYYDPRTKILTTESLIGSKVVSTNAVEIDRENVASRVLYLAGFYDRVIPKNFRVKYIIN